MRWIRTTAAIFLLGMSVPGILRADPLDSKQVPGEAKWLIHIDMDVTRPTKIWDALYTRLINDDDFQTKVGLIEQVTNMHFPRDVHDITLYGRAVGDEAGVVVLHANMDRERAMSMFQLNATYSDNAYGSYKIFSWKDKDKTLFAAFRDNSTVIVGRSEENIQAGLDVMDGKIDSIKDSPLAVGVKPQLMAYVAVRNLSELKKGDQPQSPIVKEIESGWIGLSEKDNNAVVQASLATANADTAAQLNTAMIGIKAMVSLAGGGDNADPKAKMAANALKTFQTSQADKNISVDWAIPLDQVTDLIAKLPLNGQAAEH